MTWSKILPLRCPSDTDPAPSARAEHTACDVRLPLSIDAVVRVTQGLAHCACGAKMVVRHEKESDP